MLNALHYAVACGLAVFFFWTIGMLLALPFGMMAARHRYGFEAWCIMGLAIGLCLGALPS
jgi:hypothetical protein